MEDDDVSCDFASAADVMEEQVCCFDNLSAVSICGLSLEAISREASLLDCNCADAIF